MTCGFGCFIRHASLRSPFADAAEEKRPTAKWAPYTKLTSDVRGRGHRDRGHGRGPSRDRGRGPSGDHVQSGHDRRPSNLRRIAGHRGVAQSSARPRTEAVSNSHRATCSDFQQDTNSRPPKYIQARAWAEELERRAAEAEHRCGCRRKPERRPSPQQPAKLSRTTRFSKMFSRFDPSDYPRLKMDSPKRALSTEGANQWPWRKGFITFSSGGLRASKRIISRILTFPCVNSPQMGLRRSYMVFRRVTRARRGNPVV
jgi:hypothetical protein